VPKRLYSATEEVLLGDYLSKNLEKKLQENGVDTKANAKIGEDGEK
jgi:hypothetical protein